MEHSATSAVDIDEPFLTGDDDLEFAAVGDDRGDLEDDRVDLLGGEVDPFDDGDEPLEDGLPALEFRGVSKRYRRKVVGLDDVWLTVPEGDFAFIVGPTGCGKSTLIRLILREIDPTEGQVLVSGTDIGRLKRRRVPYLRRDIGTVFQDFKLLPHRTVFQNVAYSLRAIGERRRTIKRRVPEVLDLVGLGDKAKRLPHELSAGEQQRVAIARAAVNDPPLLLADEPTGNLDPETSTGIMQLLHRVHRMGTTVLVATHDREMVDRLKLRVIELRDGRVVRDEPGGSYVDGETVLYPAMREAGGVDGAQDPLAVGGAA